MRSGREHVERIDLQCLERVAEAQNYAPVASIRIPLKTKAWIGDYCFGNAKIARIEEIVKLRAKLEPIRLAEFQVLVETQVYSVDAVSTQDASAGIADGTLLRDLRKEVAPTRKEDFFERHAGQVERGIQIWADRVAYLEGDSSESEAGVAPIEWAKRSTGLQ